MVSVSTRQMMASVAGLIGLVAAIVFCCAVPATWNHDLQDQFDAKSRIFDALRRTASTRPSREAIKRPVIAPVLAAPSETIAASELQKTILAALERAGGTVHSIQAEPTNEAMDGYQRLNAHLGFDISMNSLQKFLFRLETGVPFIFVDSITIQLAPIVTPGTRPGDTLRVELAASSYWKGSVAKAAAD